MLENYETKEIKIDNEVFRINKLISRDSYDLYLRCIAIIAPIFKSFKKTNIKDDNSNEKITYKIDINNLDIEGILAVIVQKIDYDFVIRTLKYVTKNGAKIDWNLTSPLLIFELFAHIIKENVLGEITKKDIGAMFERIIGSENSLKNLHEKASSMVA